MISSNEAVVTAGVIVAEVLQGLTRDSSQIERFLADFDMLEPLGFGTYSSAAAIYRAARSKGMSLTTIDTLIATIAIEHGAAVFTLDQDFSRIALVTSLQLHRI